MFIFMQWHNTSSSWSIGWMVKELVCGHGDESSIPSNDIINLVLNDYNMITYVVNDYNMTTCVLNNYKWLHTFIWNVNPCGDYT